MLTDKLFTGQREMTGLDIYHYGARFYSPTLGRFLSPDTIIPGYANPQSLNRFSYVTNNPLRYTDPTGHRFSDHMDPIEKEIIRKTYRKNARRGGDGGGTPTPTPTPTMPSGNNNPPYLPTQTPDIFYNPYIYTPYITPSPILMLVPAPSPTSTPTPSMTPVPFDPIKEINDAIDNQDPFAPSIGNAIPIDCPHPACLTVKGIDEGYKLVMMTLKFLKDQYQASSSSYSKPPPYNTGTPSLTVSPTSTGTSTPMPHTSTPFFRTPTYSP